MRNPRYGLTRREFGKVSAAAGIAALSARAAGAPAGYLIHGGESRYVIVISDTASASERFAADELRAHFRRCAGAELPVVNEPPVNGAPMLVVGGGPAARELGVDVAGMDLGEQGFILRTAAPHLILAGTPEAGTLYAVYEFIERFLGARWLAPGVTRAPDVQDLALPEADEVIRPAFQWRHTSYAWPGSDDDFLARQRVNQGRGGADHPHGVQHWHDGRAHSYFRFVSPDEFFDEHPEYFSEIGGERRREETQLCLTNPDVLDIVTERMIERMRSMPGARQHNFSQQDYYNYCECAECARMNEEYGTFGGTQFWFVNQLAERTAREFPDKLIGTLAYTFTEAPPQGIEMHPNVAVWLCHMYPSCQSHPIESCEHNATFKERATEWSKICSHLYMWHYIVNFAHYYCPYPNFRALAADLRFYRDIGVEGVYLQGMGHSGGGGEFSLLRPYYATQLAWDPDRDADAIMRDFLEGYYGAAWAPIHEYITMLQEKVDDEDIHMHLYTNPGQGYLPDELIARAQELFDAAEEAVADDPEMLERVKVARMPITYARLFPRNGYTFDDGALQFQGDIASIEEAAEFAGRMQRHGFNNVREWFGGVEEVMPVAMLVNSAPPYHTIRNETVEADIVPAIGGRALRITERAGGVCVTAYNTAPHLYFPFAGGEETRIGPTFLTHVVGNMDLYETVDASDSEVVLETQAGNYAIRRTFTLLDGAPGVRITTTAANISDQPQEAIVRSHLELELGELEGTSVRFTTREGETVEKDMRPILANKREGERYTDAGAPKGEWTFTGTKGVEVVQRFDDGEVDFTWLYAYPEALNLLEAEVWPKTVTLSPGESRTFGVDIEARASGDATSGAIP